MGNEEQLSRRALLAAGFATAGAGVSGCLRLSGSGSGSTATETSSIRDSDGDGVIDSEDYAPNDPEVQDRADAATETTTEQGATETATTTATEGAVVDGFESGAYDDGNPVTWTVQSPGEDIVVVDDLAVRGDAALSMLSGAADGNHAVVTNRQSGRTFEDGDGYGAWLRTDEDGGAGRAHYRLGTQQAPRGPHEIAAELQGDRGTLRVRTRDATGDVLETGTVQGVGADAWYRVDLEVRPSEEAAVVRVVDRSGSEVGTASAATTGETAVEHTTLEVPKPGGEQVVGRFDAVVLRA